MRFAEAARDRSSDKPSRFDDMDMDELRRHVAKYKAMGAKAPAVPMLRATQALARKLALREDWAQWDWERKHGKFKGMKSGPMPFGDLDSPGRGPTGKLRNFGAMSDSKLADTLEALKMHGEDHEAHAEAMKAAAHKVGKKLEVKKPHQVVLRDD